MANFADGFVANTKADFSLDILELTFASSLDNRVVAGATIPMRTAKELSLVLRRIVKAYEAHQQQEVFISQDKWKTLGIAPDDW